MRRLYQLILFIGFIFVLYLVLVRATITWVQYAPESFGRFVESVTDVSVDVEEIRIDQSWLGLDVEINALSLEGEKFSFDAKSIAFDFNIFSPWLPNIKFGKQLNVDSVNLQLKQNDFSSQEKNVHLLDFVKKIINKTWRITKLTNIHIKSLLQKNAELNIKEFQFNLADKASFVGLSQIIFDGKRRSEFQYSGSFSTDFWHGIKEGQASFSVTKAIELTDVYSLLAEKLDSKMLPNMPTGAFVGDVELSIRDGVISDLQLSSNLQRLVWRDKKNMPKNIGFSLNKVLNQTGGNQQFKFERITFDGQFLKSISPIFLNIGWQNKIVITAEKFDILVIKPVYESLFNSLGYSDSLKLEELVLKKINAVVDLSAGKFVSLSFSVPRFHVAQSDWLPGIKFENLEVSLQDERLQLGFKNGFSLLMDYITQKPIYFKSVLPYELLLSASEQRWQLKKTKLTVDNMPVKLQATGDFLGDLDLKLKIRPGTVKKVKQYLPYSLMTKDLESWLKDALVSGKNVRGDLTIKGNMKDFPFKKNNGIFYAEASLDNGELKFQPNWPAIHSFSGKLVFTPYDLTIKTKKAKLKNVDVNNVAVKVFNLASDNIAVDISGKARSSAVNAIEFLQASPLLEWAGIDGFIRKQVNLSGEVSLDLAKVWVPVYGFENRAVEVKAITNLHGLDVSLFDKIKITDLQGQLNITENSVNSPKRLVGTFQKGKAEYRLKTKDNIIHLSGSGVADVTQESGKLLLGVVPWQALVKLPLKGDSLISMSAEASLSQLASKLPAPFDDFEKLNHALVKTTLVLGKNSNDLQVKISDEMLVHMKLSENFDALNHVEFASARQSVELVNNTEKNRYFVHGLINRVDLDGWLALASERFKSSSSVSDDGDYYDEVKWQASNLTVQNLKFAEKNFKKIVFNLYQVNRDSSTELIMSADSKEIELLVSRDQQGDFIVNIEKLVFDEIKASQDPAATCSVFDESRTLPNITFRGKNINVEGKHVSKIDFKLVDQGDTIIAHNLVMKLAEKKGLVKGDYTYYKKQRLSHIEGSVQSDDIERVLDFIEVKKGLRGKKLSLNASLKWPGFIDCFSKIQLKGKVDYKLKSGVIKDAEPGLARILGLLSLESLARRLSLDVNDVTKAGLAFDSIEGYGRFNKGIFGLEKLSLKAPAANAEVFGEINLIQTNMALNAEVTPAIGSSLAVIAAISGLATPIAGLAAYGLLKVIPGFNEDLISYKYKINGSFENPEIIYKGVSVSIINATVHEDKTSILDLE